MYYFFFSCYRFEYLDDDFDLPARATIRDILSQVPSHEGFLFLSLSLPDYRMLKIFLWSTFISISEEMILKTFKIRSIGKKSCTFITTQSIFN